jgi:4-phospho-D-threonate 3-dehydrogenase / 4-phospho-D-erythronate 3-dehydrogenase
VILAVTMGDSSGVGPEILLHAFAKGELPGALAVGDAGVLMACNEALGYGVPLRVVASPAECGPDALNVLDLGLLSAGEVQIGLVSGRSGAAALAYVDRAVRLALDRAVDAVVTLPIHKEATRLGHPGFSGHTDYIAELCGATHHTMMLASDRLIVTHVSTHVALRQALDQVTAERVLATIRLTHEALPRLRPRRRIAVAGLNPHAGEGGAFGTEDRDAIEPAVARARAEGIDADGPRPPDTVFRDTLAGRYDAVVCMYHDQGHIPMKLVDFEGGVNVTLGLPIVRTSVDHGTAFDIAWRGVAFTDSLRAACAMARRLASA